MKVTVIQCGPMANESERKAVEHLRLHLQSEPGDDEWILLANLAFSVTHRMQSDEIDIIAVGPPGVRVIEVKHWTTEWIGEKRYDVEREADLVTSKARKVGTTLRREFRDLPHVAGAFLLTQDPSKVKRLAGETIRGVTFHSLNGWKDAVGIGGPRALTPQNVKRLSQLLEPRSRIAIDGDVRRLAGYVNLELQSARDERFHRVYRGSHPTRRDRVVLHLYDLSASDDKNAGVKARREFDTLHKLQLHPWAPRILDSFQDAPGYPGEMFFFTVVDPAAPSIAGRSEDATWATANRIEFARNAAHALSEFHQVQPGGEPLVHRNLTPHTILVRHDNSPILTGFDRTKIPSDVSVASGAAIAEQDRGTIAPEVAATGLAAADCRSDVYSLCASLTVLFDDPEDEMCRRALDLLAKGTAESPNARSTLQELHRALSEALGISQPRPAAPPARFWTEGQVVSFHDHDYRIVNRLGSGGVGTTFKVVEVDRSTKEDLGTYVAKVVRDSALGQQTLRAYSLARSHLGRHAGLSAIFEVAKEWQENSFIALMTWVEGTPLAEFTGVVPLLADDLQEANSGDLALRWVRDVCEAIGVLHRNGLVHGDVSPRNLIVSGGELVLTDFDFVTKIGEPAAGPGTVLYCSTSAHEHGRASPADDIYALAASIFHVLFEREPFRHAGQFDKQRGINWEGLNREEWPQLTEFLNRATHPDPHQRFASVEEVASSLKKQVAIAATAPSDDQSTSPAIQVRPAVATAGPQLKEQRISWLRDVLQSYPGAPGGNQETRGLDSKFAADTYVETLLEETLLRDIRERRVRLVILCGNAGDGKTALLQHLAQQLGLGKHSSADRILQGKLSDGLVLRMNLDGSAAWKGRSADDLLDEFLSPFQQGEPTEDLVHLLAINDGRLLEWIEGYEDRNGKQQTRLTQDLFDLLQNESARQTSHIRFISLNQRTLVGDVSADAQEITTDFLNRLLDHLYGGSNAQAIWSPCQTCSAQERCEVFRAARLFGPDGFPVRDGLDIRKRARERLSEALQAVHLRGETHITVRELRAALVYVLFGVHFCDDYHAATDTAHPPYWDRAFHAESPARQGEVLRELIRFDPALEAHPQIDRHLTNQPIADTPPSAPRYPDLSVESARRRAFFEWSRDEIKQITGDAEALDLARGRHLRLFRDLPLSDDQKRADICRRLCQGISRLEDLPPKAFDRPGVVPLRVTPRTPTETAFWVEKMLASFRLEPVLPPSSEGIERLHRQAVLVYRDREGREETLKLGAELFHLLLELADGYQLGDVSTDDTFANLSIFVQRLVQEDARELFVWNPMADDTIYRLVSVPCEAGSSRQQCLSIAPLMTGVQQ